MSMAPNSVFQTRSLLGGNGVSLRALISEMKDLSYVTDTGGPFSTLFHFTTQPTGGNQ